MNSEINWDDMQVETTITAPITDWSDEAGPAISDWHGCGQLRDWREDDSPEFDSILEMYGVIVDLLSVKRSVWDVLDARSGDYELLASIVFDASSNNLRPELLDALNMPPSTVVFIDRVTLAPEYRDRGGIGRVLIGRILWQLIRMSLATVVVTSPYPFEIEPESPEFDAELQKVQHIWESIGFFPMKDRRVWVMDWAMAAHSRGTRKLEKRLGL